MYRFVGAGPAALCGSFMFVLIVAAYYYQLYDVVKPMFQQVVAAVGEVENILIPLYPQNHVYRDSQTLERDWHITQGWRRPDGVKKLVYLINGEFPGPTIELRSGDSLSVTVHNGLEDDEGIAIHWHGLFMKYANDMDGVVGITQKATKPGGNFTYNFHIADDQAGTFWYHSHSELQRADGLFGALVVHDPSTKAINRSWEEEKLLMIGDWYHRTAHDIQSSYVTYKSWGREPVPDSLLINGRGAFNCSMAVPSRPLDCISLDKPSLVASPIAQRLRIINVGAMSGITLNLQGANMTPLTVDGGNEISAQSSVSSVGVLYPGERLDVILQWDLVTSDVEAHLEIELDDENYTMQNKALTPTQQFPISPRCIGRSRVTARQQPEAGGAERLFNISEATGTGVPQSFLQPLPDQTILIYTKIEMLAHFANVPMGYLNRTSWAPQDNPLIKAPRSQWDDNQLVPWVEASNKEAGEAKWVDIVVNNLDEKGHPFHMHGYDFYVLSIYKSPRQGYHTYNPFLPSTPPSSPDLLGGPYNLVNPPKKDTVYIPRMGYAVLRIRADNPGIWFFHCHILWHQDTGMAMAIQVGGEPP